MTIEKGDLVTQWVNFSLVFLYGAINLFMVFALNIVSVKFSSSILSGLILTVLCSFLKLP